MLISIILKSAKCRPYS